MVMVPGSAMGRSAREISVVRDSWVTRTRAVCGAPLMATVRGAVARVISRCAAARRSPTAVSVELEGISWPNRLLVLILRDCEASAYATVRGDAP